MPRKRPGQYEAGPVSFEEQPFDEDVVRRTLEEARVTVSAVDPSALSRSAERLNVAALLRQVGQDQCQAPTEHMSGTTLKQIRRHAAALLKELPLTDDDGLGGAGDNPRVVIGVARLLTPAMDALMDARVAQERDERGRGPEADEIFGARNAADVLLVLHEVLKLVVAAADAGVPAPRSTKRVRQASPTKVFAYTAAQEYRRLSGRSPHSSSWDTLEDQVSGPLVRFLAACCRHLGEEVAPSTIDEWIDSWRAEAEAGSSRK
jgi:hypothetical protein